MFEIQFKQKSYVDETIKILSFLKNIVKCKLIFPLQACLSYAQW